MRSLLAIYVLFAFFSCASQGENEGKKFKDTTMEIFNIREFNAQKDEADSYTFTDEGGRIVNRYGDEMMGYFEYSYKADDLFETRKAFHPNGKLKVIGEMFRNRFEKGIWVHYDENGKKTKSINYDQPFGFDWEDIKSFCKDKKVPLYADNTRIRREVKDSRPVWIIEFQIISAQLSQWTLDGISGEVLKEAVIKLDKG